MKPLTPRELQVLHSFCGDRMNKEVARDLKVSIKTVEKHRDKIYKKLGCHTGVGMVIKASKLGLVCTHDL